MAADSIAQLAVIIRGDASDFEGTMNRAALSLRRWSADSEDLNAKAFKMSQALSAARGNLGALVSIAQQGGLATGIVAAAAAAGVLAFRLAKVSDAQRVAAAGGKAGPDSWAGQWERAAKAAGSIAATLGRPIADIMARETKQIADILTLIADRILPDELRQEQHKLAILERQKQLMRDQASLKEQLSDLTKKEVEQFMVFEKRRAELRAKAELQGGRLSKEDNKNLQTFEKAQRFMSARGFQRRAEEEFGKSQEQRMDELRGKAERLAESLRTPRQDFIAALAEARQLFDAGVITGNMFAAAADAAADKFAEAEEHAANAKRNVETQARSGIAAVDRFSMSGFSAVQSGMRELDRLERVQKDQLAEIKRQTAVEEEIADAIRNFEPVNIVAGSP